MRTRCRAVLSIGAIALSVGLAASGCSSGSTAGVESASSSASASASASASPAFPSESVAPDVQKDSVEDLNSTKDMTGVITTIPGSESPYIDYLPNICRFVSAKTMAALGVQTKRLGFRGTRLVSQVCSLQHLTSGSVTSSIAVNFYINNIEEITQPSRAVFQQKNVRVSPEISGDVIKLPESGPGDTTFQRECGTAWGTFFGAIVVRFRDDVGTPGVDPCAVSLQAARLLAPEMPKSPSQMRPQT